MFNVVSESDIQSNLRSFITNKISEQGINSAKLAKFIIAALFHKYYY
jgi:hypothetical protein